MSSSMCAGCARSFSGAHRWLLAAAALLAPVGLAALSACQDPCVTLAERICNCATTTDERDTCQRERVAAQQSTLEIDTADRNLCEAKLETCTCTAIDENNLDACGFAPVGDSDGQTEGAE